VNQIPPSPVHQLVDDDGAKNIYHVDDGTPKQLDEAVEMMTEKGVLFLE
jgi:hypothetical protein